MNIIFLRGAIPPDNEHPEKLKYDNIDDCDDMWTQLFYYLSKKFDSKAEMLYDGKSKINFVCGDFSEKWVSLSKYIPPFKPDMIVCRGGFDFYLDFLRKYPTAKKIYYGAGKRFYPEKYNRYDLFLVDSESQLDYIRKGGKNVSLFIKPAATLFHPVECSKQYDVCLVANYSQRRIKRHDVFINAVNKLNVSSVIIGNVDRKITKEYSANKNIHWLDWRLRRYLPEIISSCRVGVCCSSSYDSCPRVIPEYLACDIPIVVTSDANVWREKYICGQTGIDVNKKYLHIGIKKVLDSNAWSPYKYYSKNLSMNVAVDFLADKIKEMMGDSKCL